MRKTKFIPVLIALLIALPLVSRAHVPIGNYTLEFTLSGFKAYA